MKAFLLAVVASSGVASAAVAQVSAPPAVVDHKTVHVQTVTHNDGKAHRQVTNYRHRTIVKTPHGTLINTKTTTTTTQPK
jgi:hypothetical protein